MFYFKQKLSRISEVNEVIDAKIKLDTSGNPILCWIEDVAGSGTLKICTGEKSYLAFDNRKLCISKSISSFDFLIKSNVIYFTYVISDSFSSKVCLLTYSISDSSFGEEISVDAGDVSDSFIFDNGVVLISYIKDGSLICKNLSLSSVYPLLSSVNLSLFERFKISAVNGFFLMSWSVNNGTSVKIKTQLFNSASDTLYSEKEVSVLDGLVYDFCVENDQYGRDYGYGSFYLSISERYSGKIKLKFFEFDETDDISDFSVFSKIYFPNIESFSSIPKIYFSVSKKQSILVLDCEDLFVLKSENIRRGFIRSCCPNGQIVKSKQTMIPLLNDGVLHYIFMSDNVCYGKDRFVFEESSVGREFILSDSSRTYINNELISSVNNKILVENIKDSLFDTPLLCVRDSVGNVSVFNKTQEIPGVSFLADKKVDRVIFDKLDSSFVYLLEDKIYKVNSFNSVITVSGTMAGATDFCISDTGISVVSSTGYLYYLDKQTLKESGSINLIGVSSIYCILPDCYGSFYVKCKNSSNEFVLLRILKSGQIIQSFPSFDVDNSNWRLSYLSVGGRKVCFAFNSGECVSIDSEDGSYNVSFINDVNVLGVCADDYTGQIFVSCYDSVGNYVVEIGSLTGNIIRKDMAITSGLIRVIDSKSDFVCSQFSVVDSLKRYTQNNAVTFSSVYSDTGYFNEESPVYESKTSYSFSAPNQEENVFPEGIVPIDLWHFRDNGFSGAKVSINKDLTFDSYNFGDLRKSPVFSWSYSEADYVDSFIISDGTNLSKMAVWSEDNSYKVELVKTVYGSNIVRGIYVDDPRIFVSSGGYISVLSYDSLNFIFSNKFCSDIRVYDNRFGYVWAGSESRGTIFRISYDLSDSSEIDVGCFLIGMVWSDFLCKFIVQGKNSLSSFDINTLTSETFYDANDKEIYDICVNGGNIGVMLVSYQGIPIPSEYASDSLFESAKANRFVDNICVLDVMSKKYVFSKNMAYDFISVSIFYDGNEIIVIGYDSSGVRILIYDSLGNSKSSFTYQTLKKPIDLVYLPYIKKNVIVLDDGVLLEIERDKIIEIFSPKSLLTNKSLASDLLLWPYLNSKLTISSNGLFVRRSDVGRQTGSSSSSSSSSNSSGSVPEYRTVQLTVGTFSGGSDVWDSGAIVTDKTSAIYGGGDNLEPGQEYFVSVRILRKNGEWSPYSSSKFILSNFYGFKHNEIPSSSSSSNVYGDYGSFYELFPDSSLNISSFYREVVFFNGNDGDEATLIFGSETIPIKNVSGLLSIYPGDPMEKTLSFIGDTCLLNISGEELAISLISDSKTVFSIYK